MSVYREALGHIQFITAPPGKFQQMRNEGMRSKRAAGKGMFEAVDNVVELPEWVTVKEVFGYEAEDDADDWWIKWGLLRERARAAAQVGPINVMQMDVKVSHTVSH